MKQIILKLAVTTTLLASAHAQEIEEYSDEIVGPAVIGGGVAVGTALGYRYAKDHAIRKARAEESDIDNAIKQAIQNQKDDIDSYTKLHITQHVISTRKSKEFDRAVKLYQTIKNPPQQMSAEDLDKIKSDLARMRTNNIYIASLLDSGGHVNHTIDRLIEKVSNMTIEEKTRHLNLSKAFSAKLTSMYKSIERTIERKPKLMSMSQKEIIAAAKRGTVLGAGAGLVGAILVLSGEDESSTQNNAESLSTER